MNFLVVSALLCSAALVGCKGRNLTLSDVYGEVAPVESMESWSQRSKSPLSDEAKHARFPVVCDFNLEVYIVQDNTASTRDNYAEMRYVQLPALVSAMQTAHGGTYFGAMSFRDKPIWSLGDPNAGDYCQRFETPLSKDSNELYTVYDNLVPNGGADPAENQFGALVAAMQSPTAGWTGNGGTSKLIVLVTDAPPHFEGDGLNAYGMTTFSGTFDEANADGQCLAQYYPTPEQVKSAIHAREAYVGFAVFDGDWWNELPIKSWEWFNGYIGQTPEFVGQLAADASNFFDTVAAIIHKIEQLECGWEETSSTTEYHHETTTVSETTQYETPVEVSTIPQAWTTWELGTEECPPCQAPPCPPCPEPCHCNVCPCPEVAIQLAHRPKHMRLELQNE